MDWLELGAEDLFVSVSQTNSFILVAKWSQHYPHSQSLFSILNSLCATPPCVKPSRQNT